jgi:hypothetical protein
MPPDPFRNDDERWEPWQPAGSDDNNFSMPDDTPSTIKNFLREAAKAALNTNHTPAKPAPFHGAPINIPKGY